LKKNEGTKRRTKKQVRSRIWRSVEAGRSGQSPDALIPGDKKKKLKSQIHCLEPSIRERSAPLFSQTQGRTKCKSVEGAAAGRGMAAEEKSPRSQSTKKKTSEGLGRKLYLRNRRRKRVPKSPQLLRLTILQKISNTGGSEHTRSAARM